MARQIEDPLLRVKAEVEKQAAAERQQQQPDMSKMLMDSLDKGSTRMFPGMDGIPFRLPAGQQVPSIKKDDPEHMQPRTIADAHVRMFNMAKPADIAEYEKVWDKAAKGLILISKEDMHWSDKEQTYIVFLRWGELYLELSKEGIDAHRSFK